MRIIFLILLYALSACNKSSNITETQFHVSNEQNDTDRIIVTRRIAFDTTVSSLSGQILDRETNKPLQNVKLILVQNTDSLITFTNEHGYFSYKDFTTGGIYELICIKEYYGVLIVDNISIKSGESLALRVKLEWID